MRYPYKLVVFDFDGTLVDSIHMIARGILLTNEAFHVKAITYEKAKSVIGMSLDDMMEIIAPDLEPSLIPDYIDHYVKYFRRFDPFLKLFPGSLDLIHKLKENGMYCAVATGKSRFGLSRITGRMKIEDLFDWSICCDEAKPKPDPDMLIKLHKMSGIKKSRMIMVGDSEHDVRMAQTAGVDVIAVSWGARNHEQLVNMQPTKVVDNMQELASSLGL